MLSLFPRLEDSRGKRQFSEENSQLYLCRSIDWGTFPRKDYSSSGSAILPDLVCRGSAKRTRELVGRESRGKAVVGSCVVEMERIRGALEQIGGQIAGLIVHPARSEV